MEIPRHWRLRQQRYGLIGEIGEDGIPRFPPGKMWPKTSQDLILFPRQLPSFPNEEVVNNIVIGNNHDN